ncbi:Vitamin K epoxide reductase family protein [Botrimarina colliarenosi]|uniref:Vitamin K epoxide reductase family protein n=1 Tax=Botrimarina colliarenosi TaxID=2528001 RepID=A0A5C6AI58_9BACT|nr:vitamin K epoxide reductase family protein [Botrimarina colliarenosi]TWT99732.1 Vitamin K epoxide reductase family protein [Botrimarina colliarenosi]
MVRVLPWIVRTLAAAALGLSAFLWWSSATTASAVGCDAFAGFDCDAALGSPWAKLGGVPVAAGGTLCYAAALVGSVLAWRRGGAASLGWRLLELTAPLAVGAGVWFTAVQAAALDSFCFYCLATHACGLAMAVAVLLWRRAASAGGGEAPVVVSPFAAMASGPATETDAPPSLGVPTLVGLLGVIALAGGQTLLAAPAVSEYDANLTDQFVFTAASADASAEASPRSPEPTTEDPSEPAAQPEPESTPSSTPSSTKAKRRSGGSRLAAFLNGKLRVDAYEQAVLGSPDAPHLVVEMMDYACPHCREFHDKLTKALERFDGQIAVLVMPVPGEIACNKHVRKARKQSLGACFAAKLSMAVSDLDPEEFEAFHAWMLHDDTIPNRTRSLIEARRHVDGDELSAALRDTEGALGARIKNYVELAAAIGKQGRFGLPAQILGDRVVAGPSESVDALCKLWAEAFGLETPTATIPF